MAFQRREILCQQGEPFATINVPEIKKPATSQLLEVSVLRDEQTGRYMLSPITSRGEKVYLTEAQLKAAKERGLSHVEVYNSRRVNQ